LENKNIEMIFFHGKLFKIKKDNNITSKGLTILKESLIKNQFLKKINFLGINFI
jgi:hypothetical protein